VRLALFQALRCHEIAKIRAEDFDLAAGWLMVSGKGGKTQPIPIDPEIAKLAGRMPEIGFWFSSTTSPLICVQPVSVSTAIANALRLAGSDGSAHMLRDTAATRMQRMVGDIRITQAMLRHSNITSTMKYTQASNAELVNAVNGMTWTDRAQREPASAPSLPDLAFLTPEQMQGMAAELLTALAERQMSAT
jgi:integrase/recombinase XerD